MAFLSLLQLLLIHLLFRSVIEFAINRVIVMRLPIFLHSLQILILPLLIDLLHMVLLIVSSDNVILLLMVVDEVLLALLGQLEIPVLKVEFG